MPSSCAAWITVAGSAAELWPLAPQITSRFKIDGVVNAMTLDGRLEQVLRQSLSEIARGTGGSLDPELLRRSHLALADAGEHRRHLQRRLAPAIERGIARNNGRESGAHFIKCRISGKYGLSHKPYLGPDVMEASRIQSGSKLLAQL